MFRQQVIATVSGVVRLYWDLASLNEDVRVRQEAVTSAEQFLSDNKNQIEAGTVAPVDVTRAEAELSRRQARPRGGQESGPAGGGGAERLPDARRLSIPL